MDSKKISRLVGRPDFQENPVRAILKRIIWRLHWVVGSKPWKLSLKQGYSLYLTNSGSCALIYYSGCSEPETGLFIAQFLKTEMVFIDIGAHIGEFTLLAANLVGDSGQVYAFEPNPKVYDVLERNRLSNKFQNITINCMAVAEGNGDISFRLRKDPSISSIDLWNRNDDENFIKVPVIKLDTYLKDKGHKVDLIKLDVEGAELLVFKGATGLLELPEHQAPVWLFEYIDENYARFGYKLKDVISFLSQFGYSVMRIELNEHEIYAVELDDRLAALNGSNLIATKAPAMFRSKEL